MSLGTAKGGRGASMASGVVSMLIQWGRDLDLVLQSGAIERAREEATRGARHNEAKAALDSIHDVEDARPEVV